MKIIPRLSIAILIGCAALFLFWDFIPGQTGIYLSEWELKIAGYYAYALPEKVQKQNNWSRKIYIYSFGCAEGESDDKYRPMRTWYENEAGDIVFDFSISPRTSPFIGDLSQAYEEVTIESNWIRNHQVKIYNSSNNLPVAVFTDIFGMEVVAGGSISKDELINLLDQIDYLGPNPDKMGNPWSEACS